MSNLILMPSLLLIALIGSSTLSAQNTFPSSGNAGIGTTNPSARLEIADAGQGSLRVGITSNRANTYTQILNSLAVIGNDNLTVTSNVAGAWNFYNNGNSPSWSGTIIQHTGTAITGNSNGMPASNQGTLLFQNVSNGVIASNGANIIISPLASASTYFLTDGTVGIGTGSTQGYKLAVNGQAIFTRAVVKAYPNWPDYVFRKDYQLPALDSLDKFIQTYRHLPGIPSAGDIENTGLDLGSNQAALLKKIEELTLYIIGQDKTIQRQSREAATVQARLERLEQLVNKSMTHQ
jgi:hypothetical protein